MNLPTTRIQYLERAICSNSESSIGVDKRVISICNPYNCSFIPLVPYSNISFVARTSTGTKESKFKLSPWRNQSFIVSNQLAIPQRNSISAVKWKEHNSTGMYKMNMEVSMQFVDIPLIIVIVPSIFLLLVATMKKRTCKSRVYFVVVDHLIAATSAVLAFLVPKCLDVAY